MKKTMVKTNVLQKKIRSNDIAQCEVTQHGIANRGVFVLSP